MRLIERIPGVHKLSMVLSSVSKSEINRTNLFRSFVIFLPGQILTHGDPWTWFIKFFV